jgi:hypothetical protein
METWKWIRSDYGDSWHRGRYHADASGLNLGTKNLLAGLYRMEEETLLFADPYYVSGEMCEVIEAAAQTFAPEPLLETDLLSLSGYAHFATPFLMPDRYQVMTHLCGFSWRALATTSTENEAWGFSTSDEGLDDAELEERADGPRGVALTLYAEPPAIGWEDWSKFGPPPGRVPIHHTPWWYGMEFEGNEIDEAGARTGVEHWWKILQTTLRLMQQRIAVRAPSIADRATRRRGTRLGFPEREVVVVKLRRESNPPADEGGAHDDANYSHRFIVSGHWRNQWYPASNVHRQIWISPYVKGPEDQPLVVRPRRVFDLSR